MAKREAASPQLSETLQNEVDDGSLKDPISALIQIQQHEESRRDRLDITNVMFMPFLALGIGLTAIVVFLLAAAFLIRYYPVYNFVWGDYAQQFQLRENGRKFWLIAIGVGIVVSCIGGLIANRINFF